MKVVIQWKQFLFCKICPAAGAAFTKWPDLNYFILKIHQNFQIIFCKDCWTFWKWLVSNNCPSKAILHVYSSCHFSHKCHLLVTLPSIPFNNFFAQTWVLNYFPPRLSQTLKSQNTLKHLDIWRHWKFDNNKKRPKGEGNLEKVFHIAGVKIWKRRKVSIRKDEKRFILRPDGLRWRSRHG